MRVPTEHLPYLAGYVPDKTEIGIVRVIEAVKATEKAAKAMPEQIFQLGAAFARAVESKSPIAYVPKRFVPQGYKTPYAKPKRRTRHAGTIFPSASHGNRAVRRKDMKGVRKPTKCTNRRKH